ncbi:glucoamylase family protein [Malikia sp.]|uniref:GH36-type glycosyl hydrolase domain-containing protein n=1 Tax=Malikia sp. TaxID=2070706 RepID=UPI002638BCC7|nr:glucoamylase family protein [Malikia sp.]MDD2728627.1 glucoamylase family protein [Malikia sp.]
MARSELWRLLPDASPDLCRILDPAEGQLQSPIRSEIFGLQRFAQHGQSLGDTHLVAEARTRGETFFPRLQDNIRMLREACAYLGAQAGKGYDVSPASEWLLDNSHVIEAQLQEIHEGLPRRYFQALPKLLNPPLAGLPRVYGVAWAFVAHTDSAFDDELLIQFLGAYQQARELRLCEVWALPITLRVVLIENLRRLAEREATHKAAREVANLCCDRLDRFSLAALDQLLAWLERRGVGRAFLLQMAQRLQVRRATDHALHQEWLHNALPDLAALQTQQGVDQAADNLSVSNALTSLRTIGAAEWPEIVARTNPLMQLMLTSPLFEAEDGATRDQTLHGIERLARRGGRSEYEVGKTLLELMHSAQGEPQAVAGHWLTGAGRPRLVRALGLPARAALSWRVVSRPLALPVYLGSLLLGSLGLVTWLLSRYRTGVAGVEDAVWMMPLVLLMLFPASEAVVAVINRLISESLPPDRLPRLALAQGIPPEHRVLVVIPCMLGSEASIDVLVHRLRLHYLANPERHAQFALLSDWVDADQAQMPADAQSLNRVTQQIMALNARHPRTAQEAGIPPRFIVLHRERQFSETEQRWIGWERKRGKIESLIAALAQGESSAFMNLGEVSRLDWEAAYVVTLDSDTQLPPGRLRELVSVAAHPHNQPQLDADGRHVVAGYGILQPRIVTPLPEPRDLTRFHWLFAGQCGVDPYSAASSEVYQDLFREGTFTGKGLLNVRAMHAVLSGRLPEGWVLSHDLLEGALARCAALTDITVVEEAPFHADVAASRVHRWTRGDWQLLPFLCRPGRYRLRAINRWKMFDNLRRALVAPMSLALLLLTLAGASLSPWAALFLVLAAFSAGPLLGALAGLSPGRPDVARARFYRQALDDLARALWGGLWLLVQLQQQALLALDAMARALYRMGISQRHLLQWTTAAAAQAQARTQFAALLRLHWKEPLLALCLLAGLWLAATPWPALSILLCLLWASAPVATWWASRPRPARQEALPQQQQAYLAGIARDTWRLFERCVGAQDHHLPPDNLQTWPYDMVAHRTSPTNIGLYLLSVACARQFGWIGTRELLTRLEATLATLQSLQRHRGHFFNWYDTQTLAPLLPMYVSTVDSGNLSGHLLAVGQACLELAQAPHETGAAQRALQASRQRLAPLLEQWPDLAGDQALAQLLALPDPLQACQNAEFERLLRAASDELAAWRPDATREPSQDPTLKPGLHDQLRWLLSDHLATLRSAWLDTQAQACGETSGATQRLQAIAHEFGLLAWQADFAFLYHGQRHLFHIGYRVAEQQLDAGLYDLLASESRLTSLLAIAKGDVPVRHWAALGRPFYASGAQAGLRSWAGSMFEYLMPGLVLAEPPGSALDEACALALREQMAFGAAQGLPWGISESAHAGQDYTLAYQYAPQGVPSLALRRTPPDELVIAPYATALAAQRAPQLAAANFAALEQRAGRARYGFMEALDFSPARQVGKQPFRPVRTFMAHHQGMSLIALANLLLDAPAQRWGMANAHIEAVASLLHERAPRELPACCAHAPRLPAQPLPRPAQRLLREVVPGQAAVESTHLLSNGRYHVTLRANGAGWSRWGQAAITRWRDDALRDAHGHFFYLRRLEPGQDGATSRPVSLTQHPAPDSGAHYKSTHHADRICFDASWPDLAAHLMVWVSPEDDIEFREVELRNLSDRPLELELMSAFELALTDPRADEAHPAFTSLFVRAQWQPQHQALWFERQPRLPSEPALSIAHFLVCSGTQGVDLRVLADRQRWRGRNRACSQPLADFPPWPAASADVGAPLDDAQPLALETGLDPVCAMSVRLSIAPNAKARLTFATAASDQAATLRAVVDKYRQRSHVQRASLMSATLSRIRLDALGITAENFALIQTMTTAVLLSLTRPQARSQPPQQAIDERCDRRLLWRFGISGDRPIILVRVSVVQNLGLLRSLAQALRWWTWGGVACDLVVVSAEPSSYQMPLHRDIATLRERYEANIPALSGNAGPINTGFHVLRADEVGSVEASTLNRLACLVFHADGRPLQQHMREWTAQHEQDRADRRQKSVAGVTVAAARPAVPPEPRGAFDPDSGEFRFETGAGRRPARPWVNVLANQTFGTLLSEAGGGYSWAVNSRLNQLTAWSNDPVVDPPAEWFLLQDLATRQIWSVTASAWGDGTLTYRVSHGPGQSRISHRRGELEVTASWCVDPLTSVKQISLRLVNQGRRPLQLRVMAMAEWMLGASRVDRNTVHTALHRQRLPSLQGAGLADQAVPASTLTALLGTQSEHASGFGQGTAFLAAFHPESQLPDWTCDRREFFDASGALVWPDPLGQRQGAGLDPCAALVMLVSLSPGEMVERVFLLGYGADPEAARQLASSAVLKPAGQRQQEVRASWDGLLGSVQVKTPDPLFDVMVNRWLLYQAVACRLWAKAGFYQAGGATGFRDQLQDAMALAWAAPDLLRQQILHHTSRQFVEGDVQHWWHAPTGAGVRTHSSDDLLWLPHACVHYLRASGDLSLLDQSLPFLEGPAIPEQAEDWYGVPAVSARQASVYEHCALMLDRSLRVGAHGLPLMGGGDWNDGMNRVGHEGRGESVWLGWFLCRLVADFAPLARARGDQARASRWESAAQGWQSVLNGSSWDGQWFKRAYFDDGRALGSQANAECRIDLIAQAWSVLSGAADPDLQRLALAAVRACLVDREAGLIRLLDPPFAHASPSAGYIQAYPAGVRENGAQYTHAGVWTLMAQAGLASRRPADSGLADLVYDYFTYLSPAHRASHPVWGPRYRLEPYVVAADIYSQPPYVGRGGWSWYTGAAAWLHRAAIESICGLQLEAKTLHFRPCLPGHWPRVELTLHRAGRSLRFILVRATASEALAATESLAAQLLLPGQPLAWSELESDATFVIPLLDDEAAG